MREIKFRALAVTGEMVHGSYIHSPKNKGCLNEHRIYEHSTGIEHDIIIETIGQFTGMKDIKGIDIYEGDLVEFTRGVGNWQMPSHKIQTDIVTIIWDNERCCFNIKYGNIVQKLNNFKYSRYVYKIIGNIYENKELLN